MSAKAEKGNGGMKMNRKMKNDLRMLYQWPDPRGKQEFLKTIPELKMTHGEFLRSQAGYISKWNWLISAAVFICGIIAGAGESTFTGVLSAMLPILALSLVADSSRSVRHGMEELEMSAKFSLKAVLTAKFIILGTGNIILLAVLFPMLMGSGKYEFIYTALLILFPYLLSCFCNLVIIRKIHRKENIYYCSGVSALICIFMLVVIYREADIYSLMRPLGWGVILIILAVMTVREGKKVLHQSEEFVWSL